MQRRAAASAATLLDTPRLRLRPPRPEDAAVVEAVLADAAAGDPVADPPETGDAWVTEERERLAAHGLCRLAVTLRGSGEVLGYCGLRSDPLNLGRGEAELALGLLPERRGRGYGSEAAGAALVHGFLACGLVRVVARPEPRDLAAIRALESVGLRLEGLSVRPGAAGPRQLYALERPL